MGVDTVEFSYNVLHTSINEPFSTDLCCLIIYNTSNKYNAQNILHYSV